LRYGVSLVSAIAIAIVSATSASPAPVASQPWIADSDASAFFQYSAWSYENQIDRADCKGTGAPHKLVAGTAHSTFSCSVETDGKTTVVAAKALGPEWLRVTSVSGGLKPDPGIGAVPSGKQTMDDDQAESALEDSAWGQKAQIDDAFCSGIGPYKDTPDAYLFGAFDCATIMFGRSGPQVLVAVSGSAVRVTKTFTR
jgi:hypothetical protein